MLEWVYLKIKEFISWLCFLGGLEGIFFGKVMRNVLEVSIDVVENISSSCFLKAKVRFGGGWYGVGVFSVDGDDRILKE